VSIGRIVGDHFQHFACAPQYGRNNSLIKEVLHLLGLILDERFDLVMLEVMLNPGIPMDIRMVALPFLSGILVAPPAHSCEWADSETNAVSNPPFLSIW